MNLLIETLLAILILAVAFTSFLGVVAQSLEISSKSKDVTDVIAAHEPLLFQMERGLRLDWIDYGGTGKLPEGYKYRIESDPHNIVNSNVKTKLTWKKGRESLGVETTVLRAPVQ